MSLSAPRSQSSSFTLTLSPLLLILDTYCISLRADLVQQYRFGNEKQAQKQCMEGAACCMPEVFAVGIWAGSAAHLSSNPGLAFRACFLQTFDGMKTGPAFVAVAVFLREKEVWLGNKVTRLRSCPLPSQCKNPWEMCPWGFKHFWQPGLQEKPLEKPLLLPDLSQFIKESRNKAERCKRSVCALSFLLFDRVC